MTEIAVLLRKRDPVMEQELAQLRPHADIRILYDHAWQALPDAEMLITTHLTAAQLNDLPKLRYVFLFKTGMDALPVGEMQKRGIQILPSHANAAVIAEHAVTLALSLLHRIPEYQQNLHSGIWYSPRRDNKYQSLSEMRAGILGYGHIGRAAAEMLRAFRCSIFACNRSGVYDPGVQGVQNLAELIERSQIMFICLPLTDETRGLIDAEALRQMQNRYLINIARAEIVDENALYAALREQSLAGYASDVWYAQPSAAERTAIIMPSVLDFTSLPDVVMTPHCATHSAGAHARYIADAVRQCKEQLISEYSRLNSN